MDHTIDIEHLHYKRYYSAMWSLLFFSQKMLPGLVHSQAQDIEFGSATRHKGEHCAGIVYTYCLYCGSYCKHTVFALWKIP